MRIDSPQLSFEVVAPSGWAKFPEATPNAEDFLLALRYEGSGCNAALQITLLLDDGSDVPLDKIVARDMAEAKESPTVRVVDSGKIRTRDGHQAIGKHVLDSEEGNYAVAYVKSKAGVVILGLGEGKDQICFRKLLSDFKTFVRSYREIGRE